MHVEPRLSTPDLNTLVMNDLLSNLLQMLGSARHAVLVWDNAGFHTSGSLEVPENITLLSLLSHTPERNPIGRLCRYLRSRHLSTRAFVDREHLEQAAHDVCPRLDSKHLSSSTRTPWVMRSYEVETMLHPQAETASTMAESVFLSAILLAWAKPLAPISMPIGFITPARVVSMLTKPFAPKMCLPS